MIPARQPRVQALGGQRGLEHLLNGTPDRRNRAWLPQPRAATLREERPSGLPGIPREKNDSLVQGRILTRQNGVEGWPVQVGHMQVAQNHVVMSLLDLDQGVLAIARRADTIAIPPQQAGQGADHARLIVNHQNGARGARCHDLPRSHRPERSASRRRPARQRRREGGRDAGDVSVEAVHAKGTWSTKVQKICHPLVDVEQRWHEGQQGASESAAAPWEGKTSGRGGASSERKTQTKEIILRDAGVVQSTSTGPEGTCGCNRHL